MKSAQTAALMVDLEDELYVHANGCQYKHSSSASSAARSSNSRARLHKKRALHNTSHHGVRHGFKIGGAKTIIELESEPKFNINL